MEKQKVLVTGATGYVGRRVVEQFCEANFEVVAVGRRENPSLDPRATYIRANIFEIQNPFQYFGEPYLCVHAAWSHGFDHNSTTHISELSRHFDFIQSLVLSGLKSLSVLGSMHELGLFNGVATPETPDSPITNYALAKSTLHSAVSLLTNNQGIDFRWLRIFYIFGDDSFGSSVFSKIRAHKEKGGVDFPFTHGYDLFDFIDIKCLAHQIFSASLQNKHLGVINCCTGRSVEIGRFVEDWIDKNSLGIKLLRGVFPNPNPVRRDIAGDPSVINEITASLQNFIPNKPRS